MKFSIYLYNPFIRDEGLGKTFREWYGKISKNKNWGIEYHYYRPMILDVGIDIDFRGRHHAGATLCLGLFGHSVSMEIYDKRHWDYRTNSWYAW